MAGLQKRNTAEKRSTRRGAEKRHAEHENVDLFKRRASIESRQRIRDNVAHNSKKIKKRNSDTADVENDLTDVENDLDVDVLFNKFRRDLRQVDVTLNKRSPVRRQRREVKTSLQKDKQTKAIERSNMGVASQPQGPKLLDKIRDMSRVVATP